MFRFCLFALAAILITVGVASAAPPHRGHSHQYRGHSHSHSHQYRGHSYFGRNYNFGRNIGHNHYRRNHGYGSYYNPRAGYFHYNNGRIHFDIRTR